MNEEVKVIENTNIDEMVKSLITVEQLPVITEQLKAFKAEIEAKVTHLLSLEVTDETRKTVKAELASIRKFKDALKARRIEVKKQVLMPYEQFEAVFNDIAWSPLEQADKAISAKIKEVENKLVKEKEEKARSYFYEYAENLGIEFVSFEQAHCAVTLTASLKKLKEHCKAFLDKVMDDLKLISLQEHKSEILFEYKQNLNVSLAITTVTERFKAIEAEKQREFAEQAEREKATVNEQTVAEQYEPFVANIPEEVEAPPEEVEAEAQTPNEPVYQLTFTVHGTKPQLKEFANMIKNYLNERGMKYE